MSDKQNNRYTLGRWYAAPLTLEQARGLLARMDEREKARLRRAKSCVMCRVGQLIARFWLGEAVEHDYQTLAIQLQQRHGARAHALLELVYGQLLCARGLAGAALHLERGFSEARYLLSPGDYFAVLKRHSLLKHLPVAPNPQGTALEDLLTTARVIERLTAGQRVRPAPHR